MRLLPASRFVFHNHNPPSPSGPLISRTPRTPRPPPPPRAHPALRSPALSHPPHRAPRAHDPQRDPPTADQTLLDDPDPAHPLRAARGCPCHSSTSHPPRVIIPLAPRPPARPASSHQLTRADLTRSDVPPRPSSARPDSNPRIASHRATPTPTPTPPPTPGRLTCPRSPRNPPTTSRARPAAAPQRHQCRHRNLILDTDTAHRIPIHNTAPVDAEMQSCVSIDAITVHSLQRVSARSALGALLRHARCPSGSSCLGLRARARALTDTNGSEGYDIHRSRSIQARLRSISSINTSWCSFRDLCLFPLDPVSPPSIIRFRPARPHILSTNARGSSSPRAPSIHHPLFAERTNQTNDQQRAPPAPRSTPPGVGHTRGEAGHTRGAVGHTRAKW